MPHADASLLPTEIQTKTEFWGNVHTQLELLYEGQRHWITNLANTSSLIYHSLLAFPKYFGNADDKAVNWCGERDTVVFNAFTKNVATGFYLHSSLFPAPTFSGQHMDQDANRLLLGPFCGKPACQFITVAPEKARGVCADAFTQKQTVLVPNVNQYPGHIGCDGDTKSEIVIPLIHNGGKTLGVFDLDCLALNGFDHEDKAGLEKIASLIVESCNW